MSYTSNRTILQKADFALQHLVDNGGLLHPLQAKKFMRLSTTESKLLGQVFYRPMVRAKEEIDQIKFGTRVLRPAEELTALTKDERVRPDISQVKLDAQEFIGEVLVSERTLDQNIESGTLRQTIMQLLAPAVGRDLEELVINGDKNSTDPGLAKFDGILVQAQSNVVDSEGAPISDDLLHKMMKTLPARYRKNKRALRFYTSVNSEDNMRHLRAGRSTPVGDIMLSQDTPITAGGTPVVGIPLWPENLGVTGDQSAVILTHPKNIIVGIKRDIRIRWKEDIRARGIYIVVTIESDTKYAEEEGVVIARNVAI